MRFQSTYTRFTSLLLMKNLYPWNLRCIKKSKKIPTVINKRIRWEYLRAFSRVLISGNTLRSLSFLICVEVAFSWYVLLKYVKVHFCCIFVFFHFQQFVFFRPPKMLSRVFREVGISGNLVFGFYWRKLSHKVQFNHVGNFGVCIDKPTMHRFQMYGVLI